LKVANVSDLTIVQDIKLIMPTVLILLFTIFIMVTVIPYAFSSGTAISKIMNKVITVYTQLGFPSQAHLEKCAEPFNFLI
jgi:hypothetical protein